MQLRAIKQLDVDLGLSRNGQQVTLYLRLLRQMMGGQSDALQRIQAALDRGDTPSAERAAHALAGVAGSIGALRLQHAAAHLETAMRKNLPHSTISLLCIDAAIQLDNLTHALRAILSRDRSAEAPRDAPQAGLLDALTDTQRSGQTERH